MKARNTPGIAVLLVILTAAACGSAFAATNAQQSKPTPISQGMSTDQIRAIVGEPDEIVPVSSPEGTAEKWIYRRTARRDVTQDAVTLEERYAFVGPGYGDNGLGIVNVPVLRNKSTTTTQVTAMLLFEGRLVAARQWLERDVDYEP